VVVVFVVVIVVVVAVFVFVVVVVTVFVVVVVVVAVVVVVVVVVVIFCDLFRIYVMNVLMLSHFVFFHTRVCSFSSILSCLLFHSTAILYFFFFSYKHC
jgi:hypothetical protein